MTTAAMVPTWLANASTRATEISLPAWLADFRKQEWEAFLENGLPTRQDERWKYADLSFLANKQFSVPRFVDTENLREAIQHYRIQQSDNILLVFVNGKFVPSLSETTLLPKTAIACSISDAVTRHESLLRPQWPKHIDAHSYPFASLNAGMFTDGLFLYIPDNCELNVPIHLLSVMTENDDCILHPHHLILLGQSSKTTILEEHRSLTASSYFNNQVITLHAGVNAQLDYYKIQAESNKAVHLAHFFATQQQDSRIAVTDFSTGGLFARDEIVVTLQESGASCSTGGFYHLTENQQFVDHHIDIRHAAPLSKSEMLYKGVLEKTSRAVFNGRLLVEKNSQKIIAYQANHNLLLSKEAEIYSKPELEIYADDVKCKHGATTGQLDEDALFYLRARGINREDALAMLLRGFAEEITGRVHHAGIRKHAQEQIKWK